MIWVAEIDDPNREIVEMFMRTLEIDERVASALVSAELTTLEEVAYIPIQELLAIKTLSEKLLKTLRERARKNLLNDAMGRDH